LAAPQAVFERRRALIEALSSQVFRISERLGDGARTKLVNNLLAAINLAGATEVMALAMRLGLDADHTLAVIEQSSGQSWIGSDRLRRALAADPAVLARIALLAKDSALALAAADAVGAAHPLGSVAAGLFGKARDRGGADADDSRLGEWLDD
jgi:3-hydroxyisobutyrate dehydrogenase-like beta-hydroxyacid dehydrogenase